MAPLQLARGIQNKVLEAMAMALPTVVTPAAAEGIDAEPGRHLELAAHPDEFARKLGELLDSPDYRRQLGTSGRAHLEKRYGWAGCLAPLDALVSSVLDRSAAAGERLIDA